jgi:hypothetical protein
MSSYVRLRRLTATFAAILLLSIASTAWTQHGGVAASSDLYFGVLPEMRTATLEDVQGHLSLYTIEAQLNTDNGTISGREYVRYLNDTGQTLTEVAFRLYPNASYYNEGALTIGEAFAGEEQTDIELKVDDTVMMVKLPRPLAPNKRMRLEFKFTTTVPADSNGTFGVFNWATAQGTWVLADWYPIVAGYERGTGWNLEPPTSSGDPTFSEAALYDVTFSAPQEMTVVATGSEASTIVNYSHFKHRFITGPAREFSLVVDDDYVKIFSYVNGTKISAFANPGNEEGARRAVATATRSLESYSSLYGQYPFKELDLVDVPLTSGALGVSWTGMIFINGPQLYEKFRPTRAKLDSLDFTVAHEVGHQWWGSIVGANSNDHAFQVEGLTNYLVIPFQEMLYGSEHAYEQLELNIADPYLASLDAGGDGIADRPITGDSSTSPTGALLYGKAALGFLAIREEIGDEAFFAALSNYASKYSFGIATPDDLLHCFEVASGQSLDDLWSFWFEEADTTPADVELLFDDFPMTPPTPQISLVPFN